ncbi:hypothetical protein [Burkholderia oklahomensis]|uniref:hypothetical protein n=1 Tax=Burkholderia oklahomensis TaxID=342113 RepID=UPI00016A7875|nr:hypothetical protein [Burkholderia oklahomensis]AJX31140.1 hypothetical protein BG90_3306 [Burkholderia oklahomensis C6786]AOI45915.1 hypothetical protein WI23_09020 [Burkholderia oklahomensis C6786]KUY52894.1 hypothetical protein WI23_23880 [Burkholderia oklahomensis C6786]MBI0361539.1 hypothetical protein [Burkholderia oklahomensis]SUW55604.1 Uncharacterised protein [Burkholderia oklahomensis]
MKLSIFIAAACAALALTSAVHAQTSQTYQFGEGQSNLSGGAQAAPARHAAKTTHHRKQRRHHARRTHAVRTQRTYAHH